MERKKASEKRHLAVSKSLESSSKSHEIAEEKSDDDLCISPKTNSFSSDTLPTKSYDSSFWKNSSKIAPKNYSISKNSRKLKIKPPQLKVENGSSIDEENKQSMNLSSFKTLQRDIEGGRKNKSIFKRIKSCIYAARNHAKSFFHQGAYNETKNDEEADSEKKSSPKSSESSTSTTSTDLIGDVSYCNVKSSVTYDSQSDRTPHRLSLFKGKDSSMDSDSSLFQYDGISIHEAWLRYRQLYKTNFDVNVYNAGRFYDDFANLWDIIVLVKRFKDHSGKTHVYYSRANEMNEIPASLQKMHQMFLDKKIEMQKELERVRIRKLMLTDADLSKCVAAERAAHRRKLETRAPIRTTSTESVFRRLTRPSVANIYIGEDGKLLVADPDSESCAVGEISSEPSTTESSERDSPERVVTLVENKGIYQRSTFPNKLVGDDHIRIPMKGGCWQNMHFSTNMAPRTLTLSDFSSTFDIIAGDPEDDYFDFLEDTTKPQKIQSCEDVSDLWDQAEKMLTYLPESYKGLRHSSGHTRNNGK